MLWRSPKSLVLFLFLPFVLVAIMWITQAKWNGSIHEGIDVEITYQPCRSEYSRIFEKQNSHGGTVLSPREIALRKFGRHWQRYRLTLVLIISSHCFPCVSARICCLTSVLDAYGHKDSTPSCVSVYWSPTTDPLRERTMRRFAVRAGLVYGVDVVGVENSTTLVDMLAKNIGRFDAAITFDDVVFPQMQTQTDTDVPAVTQSTLNNRTDDTSESVGSDKFTNFNPKFTDLGDTSCPFSTPFSETYLLWVNGTWNENDVAPSWVLHDGAYFPAVPDPYWGARPYAAPPRYWALQHAMNIAITDVMTAPWVPVAEQDENATDASIVDSSDPTLSKLHVSKFSMLHSASSGTSSATRFAAFHTDYVPKNAGSAILSVSVLLIALLCMQLVAYEKQSGIIGLMRIMGMNESCYWSSWLIVLAGMAFIAALFATIMGVISGLQIYRHADFSIHFISLFLYITAMCAVAMLLSSCMHRPAVLNIVGFFLFSAAIVSCALLGNIMTNMAYHPSVPGVARVSEPNRTDFNNSFSLYGMLYLIQFLRLLLFFFTCTPFLCLSRLSCGCCLGSTIRKHTATF
jgi:hypothetical protein